MYIRQDKIKNPLYIILILVEAVFAYTIFRVNISSGIIKTLSFIILMIIAISLVGKMIAVLNKKYFGRIIAFVEQNRILIGDTTIEWSGIKAWNYKTNNFVLFGDFIFRSISGTYQKDIHVKYNNKRIKLLNAPKALINAFRENTNTGDINFEIKDDEALVINLLDIKGLG